MKTFNICIYGARLLTRGKFVPMVMWMLPRALCKIAHLRALHLSTRALTIDISVENFISTCTNTQIFRSPKYPDFSSIDWNHNPIILLESGCRSSCTEPL